MTNDTGIAAAQEGQSPELAVTVPATASATPIIYISIAEAARRINVSERSLLRMLNDPTVEFPRPVRLTPRGRSKLIESEVTDWQRRRPRVQRRALASDDPLA